MTPPPLTGNWIPSKSVGDFDAVHAVHAVGQIQFGIWGMKWQRQLAERAPVPSLVPGSDADRELR